MNARSVVPVAIGLVLAGLAAWGVYQLTRNSGAPRRPKVQQISLIKPPLPPKQEKPPEPEKKEEVKQEVKTPETPKEDAPAPAPDLGLDAKGVAGGDNFGLTGRPGGRDITTLGTGSGTGNGRGGAFYASQLQSELQDALNRNERLRAAEYRARVDLWLSPEGGITRVEIAGSTGDAELDERLRAAVSAAKRLKPPPEGMAQPVRLELVARRT